MLQKSLRVLWSSLSDNPISIIVDKLAPLQQAKDALAGPSRLQIGLWLLLALFSCLLFVNKYSEFQLGAYQDDASYIILAQSLVHSDSFGLIYSPGEPVHTQFPFGFPLLLVPFVLLTPENLDAFRLISLIATLVNCALLFWGWQVFGGKRSYWWALMVVALYALSPQIVDQSRMVMSEPVFTTFCLLALFLTERAAQHKQGRLWFLWMGIILVFVVFIRTVGFTLLLAVLPYLIWKRGLGFSRTLVLVFLVMGITVGVILLATPITGADLLPFGYVNQLNSEAAEAGQNVFLAYPGYKFTQQLGVYLWQFLIPVGGGANSDAFFASLGLPFVPLFMNLLLFGIIVLGFARWIRESGISSFVAFAIVYLGIVYFWTWDGRRFLYPVGPQLFFAFLLGCEFLIRGSVSRLPERSLVRRSIPALLSVLAVFLIAAALVKSSRLESSIVHMGDVYARTTWLKANTQPTDVIMTDQAGMDYLNGGRKTVWIADVYPSQAALWQDLEKYGVKYILVAPSPNWQAVYTPEYDVAVENVLPLLDSLVAQNHLKRVYSSPEALIQVFQVQP